MIFNRNPLVLSGKIEQPGHNEIKSTFGLWNASIDDAIRYGGDLTREAIKAMNLRNDRKYITVDTKIHMLMPGMSPAILGWHIDGTPRDKNKHPGGKDKPDIYAQENDLSPPRYHLLVTGSGCLTQFINKPININIPEEPSYAVFANVSSQTNELVKTDPFLITEVPSCQVIEFDWWDIHTGVLAKEKEWRYLIRVTESNYLPPNTNLREIIRMQQQVYCPADFGW